MERKIRVLTLASLAFKNVGRDLPYSKVAEALQIESSVVEKWVIDGKNLPTPKKLCCTKSDSHLPVIRAGLVSGKLSQTTQSLRVVRAVVRTFEREQWEALEKRLLAWKAGLAGVLEVVANARRQMPGHSSVQTQTPA